MIKVTVGNNVERKDVIVTPDTTLRAALDEAGINYGIGMMNLNGTPLSDDDLDSTFADFEITDRCFLLNVVKADNAT